MSQPAICPKCKGQGEITGSHFSCGACGLSGSLAGICAVPLPDVRFVGVVIDKDGNIVYDR